MVIALVLIVNPKLIFDGVRTDFGTLVTNPSDANTQMTVERCS